MIKRLTLLAAMLAMLVPSSALTIDQLFENLDSTITGAFTPQVPIHT